MNRSFLVPVVRFLLRLLAAVSLNSWGRSLLCALLRWRECRRGRAFACEPYEPRLWSEAYTVAFLGLSTANLALFAPHVRDCPGHSRWLAGALLVGLPIYRIAEIFKTTGSIIFLDRERRFAPEIGPDVGSYYTLVGNLNSWLIMIALKWLDMLLCFSVLVLWLGVGWKPPIREPLDAFYLTVVTMATLGYGDILPVTPAARRLVIAKMFGFVAYFLLVMPVVVSTFRTREIRRP